MWVALIIVFVFFVLFKYNSDKAKMLSKLKSDGGVQKKYEVLITCLLAKPGSETHLVEDDHYEISWTNGATRAYFGIYHMFGRAIIRWQYYPNLYLGKKTILKKKWEFRCDMSQEKMVETIYKDINGIIKNY